MKLYISHSQTPADWQVAMLLRQKAQSKGILVEGTPHQSLMGGYSPGILHQTLFSCDFVIAIVSYNSHNLAGASSDIQHELAVAASLGKPCLALVEQGVRPLQPLAGVQYVEFVRHNVGPALEHISAILDSRKNPENLSKWVIAGGLALLALYLISKSDS